MPYLLCYAIVNVCKFCIYCWQHKCPTEIFHSCIYPSSRAVLTNKRNFYRFAIRSWASVARSLCYSDIDRRVMFKFREIRPTRNRWSPALFTGPKKQNFASLPTSRYCAICADRAKNLPGPAPENVLRVLQISSKSVHFRWSYTRTREHHQNGP